MDAIFLSDVHLRDVESVKTKLVMRFLQEVASRHERIYILGDLFDVWPGTTPYLIQRFQPVLQIFRRLVQEGHTLSYVEGNHDFKLGEYFSNDLGIRVYPDELVEDFAGKKVLMTHGDLGNPKQLGYRVLRKLLRSPLVQTTARLVPSPLVYEIGRRTSQASRDYNQRTPEQDIFVRDMFREAACRYFDRGHDVVIMGHTHIPDDYSIQRSGRPCRYFNTGDWVRNFSYLVFDGADFYTKSHPVSEHL